VTEGIDRLRAGVVEACRELAASGLVLGSAGNVSARVGDLVLVTPNGAHLAGLAAEQLAVVGLDGTLIDGPLLPTSELPLHLAVYQAFPSVGAVAHAHSPASVAVGLTHDVLPPVHYLTVRLGGVVRVADYATFGSPELARSVVEALADRSAALMRNHGSVATGGTVEQACERLELVEWLSDVYARAAALGTPRLLDEDELAAAAATFTTLNYGQRSYTPVVDRPPTDR
jgi:L-fuculose-phosphate aldolase